MKHKQCICLLVALLLVIFYSTPVFAEESVTSSLPFNYINDENCSQELHFSTFNISSDTQAKINDVLNEKPSAIHFLNGIIDMFNEEIHTNSREFNQILNDALDATIEIKRKQDQELALSKETTINQLPYNTLEASDSNAAIAAYNQGIKLVRNKGCSQTALYMEHARDIVGQSGNGHYYHYGDAWGNYDNIAVGFGNNYCYMMQELGLIQKFGIDIYYTY